MNTTISTQNDRADALFDKGEYSRALTEYQQVFLTSGKSQESAVRAQVARALYGAARCYEQMNKTEMSAQIIETLVKRYGSDEDARIRYWVELARGASSDLPREPTVKANSGEPEQQGTEQSWEAFLEANDLTDEQVEPSQSTLAPGLYLHNESAIALIAEHDVSLQRLQQIFEAAFFECESDGEILRVQMEGAKFVLHLNFENKLIVCAAIYSLRKYASPEEKYELANTLNRNLILIRFIIHDETTFVAQYSLSFAQGVLPFHIVNGLRLMQRVLTQSVAEYDKNNLLL